MKNKHVNDLMTQEWRLPIPRPHMIAICMLLTISMLTAVFLPSPEKLTPHNSAWTTGNLPDNASMTQRVIYHEDELATESIDEEPIADADIFGTEHETSTPAQVQQEREDWFIQTVQKGDNINNIFHTLNLPIDVLLTIEDTPTYGKSLKDVMPGDKLYFLLNNKNEVISLVKPLNKTEQIRFTKAPNNQNKYIATREKINNHLDSSVDIQENTETDVNNTTYIAQTTEKQTSSTKDITTETSSQVIASTDTTKQIEQTSEKTDNIKKESTTKEESKTTEIAQKTETKEQAKPVVETKQTQIAQTKTEEQAKVVATETKSEKKTTANITPKKLYVIKIETGESLINAITRNGIPSKEAYNIIHKLKNRIDARKIHPGDELRILFDKTSGQRKATAIYLKSKKQGVVTAFLNPSDNKFYNESGLTSSSKTKFRRYPISGTIRITSNFNPYRRHPITKKIRPHNGTDFGVKIGTPVYAPADGVVTKATYQNAAGKYIVIKHAGAYSTVYMHLSKLLVKPGQKVKMNQRIALSGNTGRSTGPHLHYELRRNNKPVNAMKVNLPNSEPPTAVKNKTTFAKLIKNYKKELGIK